MPEPQLTLEARAAVRSYLLRLLAIPTVVVAAIAFVLGFLINEAARQKAYGDAYTTASSKILELAVGAASAASDAEDAKKAVEETSVKLDRLVVEVEQTAARVRTAEGFQKSEEMVAQVVSLLEERDDFQQAIRGDVGARVDELLRWRIAKRPPRENVLVWGDETTSGWREARFCPDKYYACGISVKPESDPKDRPSLSGLRVHCCEL